LISDSVPVRHSRNIRVSCVVTSISSIWPSSRAPYKLLLSSWTLRQVLTQGDQRVSVHLMMCNHQVHREILVTLYL
jgi:hypothetical protein